MSTKYQDNIGKRIIIEWGIGSYTEATILEVSPSGEMAKVKTSFTTEWVPCWKHDIIEVLPDAPAPTP